MSADVIPIETARAAPPQAVQPAVACDLDAEKAVLGSVLLSAAKLALVSAVLPSVDDFFLPAHRDIFEAMQAIAARGVEVDVILLADELRVRGLEPRLPEGVAYLLTLANAVPTGENAMHYAEIVARKSAVRKLARACIEIATRAEEEPDEAAALVLESQRLVTEIGKGRRRPGVDLAALVDPLKDEFEARALNHGRLIGLSTGIGPLDYRTGGLINGNLHIIAARTSLGKTAYACQIAIDGAVERQTPCFYASLEMSAPMLGERFFSRRARIDSAKLRTGNLDVDCWNRINAAGETMRAPGRVTITRDRSLAGIMAQARAFRVAHARERILIVVDYLQLVRTVYLKGRSREQEVAEVSASLKELAGELDAPVLALCQFNRGPESEDRDPKVTDIRESGAIENDADLIVFIVRKRTDTGPAAWFHIAKSRNGETGEIEVQWHGPTYTFTEKPGVEDHY